MVFTVSANRVARWLGLVIATFVLLYSVSLVLRHGLGHAERGGFHWLVSLDVEQNPQAWYQALTLFACAPLLAIAGAVARRQGERHAAYWFSMAALFAVMSVDEACALHERISDPLRDLVGGTGALHYAWVLAWGAVGVLLLATHARWLLALPAATRRRFLVAGTVYVAGAMGFEMLESTLFTHGGVDIYDHLGYQLLTLCEEALEMTGVVLFIRALLLHLEAAVGTLEVRLATAARGGPTG